VLRYLGYARGRLDEGEIAGDVDEMRISSRVNNHSVVVGVARFIDQCSGGFGDAEERIVGIGKTFFREEANLRIEESIIGVSD
jgi:hypothetical protein